MISFGSVFSGAGLLDLGLVAAGLNPAWAIEQNEDAAASYRRLVGDHVLCADVREVAATDLAAVDVLVGGPPCQGFSSAGQQREDDPRNQLWREMYRLVADRLPAHRPRFVMFENVPGMLKLGTHLEIMAAFASLGYSCDWRKLDAAWFGVPQHRKRVFIACWLASSTPPPAAFGRRRPTARLPICLALPMCRLMSL